MVGQPSLNQDFWLAFETVPRLNGVFPDPMFLDVFGKHRSILSDSKQNRVILFPKKTEIIFDVQEAYRKTGGEKTISLPWTMIRAISFLHIVDGKLWLTNLDPFSCSAVSVMVVVCRLDFHFVLTNLHLQNSSKILAFEMVGLYKNAYWWL